VLSFVILSTADAPVSSAIAVITGGAGAVISITVVKPADTAPVLPATSVA